VLSRFAQLDDVRMAEIEELLDSANSGAPRGATRRQASRPAHRAYGSVVDVHPRGRRAAAVMFGGAVVYAVLLGAAGVTFNITPLAFGVVVAAAAVAGASPRLGSIAAGLIGWGAAVLLVRSGPLPDDHESAAFLVGAAVGLAVGSVIAHRGGIAATAASITLVSSGVAFYFEIDHPSVLGSWRFWAVALLAWALWEWSRPEGRDTRSHRSRVRNRRP
jgi:hypothetical protein